MLSVSPATQPSWKPLAGGGRRGRAAPRLPVAELLLAGGGRRRLLGTKRRVAVFAVLVALVGASAAVAAYVLFTGASGQSQGTIESISQQAAITVSGSGSVEVPVGGSVTDANLLVHNNDPGADSNGKSIAALVSPVAMVYPAANPRSTRHSTRRAGEEA